MRPQRAGTVLGMAALVGAGLAGRRLRRFAIAERSMEPALAPGDYVVAVRRRHHRRGEIVVYEHPARPGFDLVKRVVGLPGETVEIAGGRVLIDGIALADPWADGPTHPDGRWVLRAGEVFVLGDARAASRGDSRALGGLGRVPWRVVWRYRPLPDAGRV